MAGILRYPLDRIEADSDYLQIRVIEYNAPGLGSTGGFFEVPSSSGRTGGKEKTKAILNLPVPNSVTDQNATSWKGSELTSLAAAGMKAGRDAVTAANLEALSADAAGTFGQVASSVQSSAQKGLAGLDANTRTILRDYFIAQAVNVFGANISGSELTSRVSGQVLNPNLELLFQGVQLRQFQFGFEMAPRSRAEAREIKNILNTLKKSMAPKTSTAGSSRGIFIKSPDVYRLEFKKGARKHPFLFTMKTCALIGMSVDYTGAGSYETYEDGTPAIINLALNFQELNPVYAEDYNNVSGVGY